VFLSELVGLFRSDYPLQLQAARRALAQKDAVGIQHISHTLKGALANLSAIGACNMARDLEFQGSTGDLSMVETSLVALERELARVTLKLESLCPEMVR
jgi:two-component system, sensor histidine kinase and response regulator